MNIDSFAKPPRLPLRERRRLSTETEILAAAENILAAQGRDGATMQAIATGAGLAVGTLYNYYDDRETLLAALDRRRRAAFAERLAQAAQAVAGRPFPVQLDSLLQAILAEWADHLGFYRLTLADELARPDEALSDDADEPPSVGRQITDRAKKLVALGIKEKLLRRAGAEHFPALLTGILHGLFDAHPAAADRPLTDYAKPAATFFLKGASRG